MKIQSLTLHGFKSFADRTKIDLHEGITAIVGPNGCGKSNVADALRWVLGEQRPTAIRGSRMEEAIFGGTDQRRPIHRAEVTLELSNEDGVLPVPYAEVVIGRTVYRGGESEYTLNGSPCRLRDILDLCRDTGLGANAYAIIEGRMIDAILSDRAEERRALFEEAAEVGRYKDRRRTALRRLEQADGDLQRLDDVLSEVESKVRSLARQRGRAKRFGELRRRRLQLEVAVARLQLDRAREEAARAEEELRELAALQPAEEAALGTAETEVETLRLRLTERERERSQAARGYEETRRRLEARERERLVAEERIAAAERRLEGIREELERLASRRAELEEELRGVEEALAGAEEACTDLARREEELRACVEERTAERRRRAEAEEMARGRLAEIWRELDLIEAEDRASAERLRDRGEELERRRSSVGELERSIAELRERLSASETALRDALSSEEEARASHEAARHRAERLRDRSREERASLHRLEGELAAARVRRAGLESLLRGGSDLPAVVAELLADGVEGVLGVLADAIRAPADVVLAVEAQLGAYLHGVIVEDWTVVGRVERWLRDRGLEDGLILLPRRPGPREAATQADGSSLADAVTCRGSGAAWAKALLGSVRFEADRAPQPADAAWVRADGLGQDALGAVRIGVPGTGKGVLTRRNELEALEVEIEQREEALGKIRTTFEELSSDQRKAEEELDAAEQTLREAIRRREELEGRSAAFRERLERAQAARREERERISELEGSLRAAQERSRTSADRLAELQSERERAREAVAGAKAALEEAERELEEERGRLTELQLDRARRQSDRTAVAERLERTRAALAELATREARLVEEREALVRTMAACRDAVGEGEEEVSRLLKERGRLEGDLRAAEERLNEDREALEQRESVLREARQREREHTERRHRLELVLAELRARQTAIRERLEAEWDAPLEELESSVDPPPAEGGPEDWETELDEVRDRLHRLGPVNLLAEEEYETEHARLEFLRAQRDDLLEARDDLRDSIRRINRKASEAFLETFEEVRGHFQRTFQTLFEGGECDLRLEDPTDPLDSPIEISASPRGKRTQRIHLLSGGERALTALALLFAIYLAKPSPFCLLDEVDAPLDETNVLRFVAMLNRFKADTQFIVITHNPRTIEAADWIYGVTMQEPGVSSVIGVRFAEASPQVA